MNDLHHNSSDAARDQKQQVCDSMSMRMPDLAGLLRANGIVRVVATYEQNICAFAFLDGKGTSVAPLCAGLAAAQLAQLDETLRRRRLPSNGEVDRSSGTFDWCLQQDRLLHKQTLMYRELELNGSQSSGRGGVRSILFYVQETPASDT